MSTLSDAEYKIACIIWAEPGISSTELVHRCFDLYGWKKSTVYTLLKRMIDKGAAVNEHSVLRMRIEKEQVDYRDSVDLMNRSFNCSLPRFVAAFLREGSLTKEEADELRQLIQDYLADTQ